MQHRASHRAALTLLELVILLVVLSTVAALVIPDMRPGVVEQLRSAGRVVAAELDYARNLAVTFNSDYRVTFATSLNQVVIQHVGSDTTLNVLPPSPNRSASDPPDQQILRLGALPGIREPVSILGVTAGPVGGAEQLVDHVDFGPWGETSRSVPTTLWLSAGAGDAAHHLPLTIDPVTGVVRLGDPQGERPDEW
ncbi:MAG: hypothetical protein GTO62_14395, partial [Planctomycetales bacterium]|nr:hypothetical protein [Planctomycetales bacterium]NIP70418.1 hypothetical protein [Planctomycetales bacterium]